MKKNQLIILFLVVSSAIYAQGIDTEKMDRDLEVSKNILQTLLAENDGLFWGNRVEADYLEGYGVIFTVPQNFNFTYRVASVGSTRDSKEVAELRTERARAERQSRSKSPAVVGSTGGMVYLSDVDNDSLNLEQMKMLKEKITMFFADYAILISQLKPTERIKVQSKNPYSEGVYFAFSGDGVVDEVGGGFSSEVVMKDITDYKSGNLSKQAFEAKIEFEESKKREKIQDLELFGSIMRRLYSADLSDTYFTEGTPRYERIENYGAIFYMKTFSSYSNNDRFNMPVLSRSDVTLEERQKTVIELYPKFETDLKQNIIDYGRTISSLGDDEVLSINVTLTRCNDCNLPKSIVVTVPMRVLKEVNKGSLSAEKALNEVKIKKNMD